MTELFTFDPQLQPSISRVALTGYPGAGKSTVLNILRRLQIQTIDIDTLVKSIYKEPLVQELINTQLLDRPKDRLIESADLKEFIQHKLNRLKGLEELVHPYILEKLLTKINDLQILSYRCVVVEVPLLFEIQWHEYFDTIIVIKPDQLKQHAVLKARGWGADYINFLMQRYYPYSRYIMQSDFNIENKYDITGLISQIRDIMNRIGKPCVKSF